MRQFDIKKIEKEVPKPPERPKRESSFLPYLLGFILGLALVFGIFQIKGKKEVEKPVKQVATVEEEKIEEEVEEEAAVSPPTSLSPVTPPFDKSKISISVLNGNGIRGDAYRTKLLLEKDGWKIATYGNARSFKYPTTLVYYKEGQEEAGKRVEETLKKNGKVTSLEKSTTLKKYDVLVIVGKK